MSCVFIDSLVIVFIANFVTSNIVNFHDSLQNLFHLGDDEAYNKFARRTVKVTRQHNDECKRLLNLMGVPYLEAPTEAEARKSLNTYFT